MALLAGPTLAGAGEVEGLSPYGWELLAAINRYRQEHGLGTVQPDPGLISLAGQHSIEMARRQRLSHDGFDNRFASSGSRMCTENVGWNYPTAADQFNAWRRSAGHDHNMLLAGIRRAGIAESGSFVTFFACR